MKKRIIGLVLAVVMVLSLGVGALAAEGEGFVDVPAGAWYADDVEAACATGLIQGTSGTRFSPDGTLTYAQAVTLAARLHQYAATGRVTLENGQGGQWYAPYVEYARQEGILDDALQQTIDSKGWNVPAPREDMVVLFYRTVEPGAFAPINDVENFAIPDVSRGEDSVPEVYAFYRAGIVTGDQYHKFNGSSGVKRSETAAILVRILDPSQRQRVTLAAADKMPPYDAAITEENILAVLDAMDPDGAFIIRGAQTGSFMGSMLMVWFAGASVITDELVTAVHEECHMYTVMPSSNRFYIGGGQSVTVPMTPVFDTAEIEPLIPEELRSSRYSMYVGTSADPQMASRQEGVYGLMNEYTAYCWGANNSLLTLDYRRANGCRMVSDDFLPYAEFLYYILTYMLYAKDHHPEVYNGIMANKDFLRAFALVEGKFSGVAQELWEKNAPWGGGFFRGTYDALMAEIEKSAYQQMLSLMRAG